MHEVQYAMPEFDKKIIAQQMKNPTGAIGRCGKLRVTGESMITPGVNIGYVNNDMGIHRVENRSNEPAMTLHVYAPGLRKMKIFKPSGEVSIYTAAAAQLTSEYGELTGLWGKDTDPDGILDVKSWNSFQTSSKRRPSINLDDTPQKKLKA